MTLVLGIDGGGSRTRFLLVDGRGREIARVETAGSNYLSLGAASSTRAIEEGLFRLPATPDLICGGFAGAGRTEGRRHYEAILKRIFPHAVVSVETDALMAYVGALGMRPGLLLIAGTGSIAIGRRADGTMIRAGGWGAEFGDEGGGLWIGREAVRAALLGYDFDRHRVFQDRIARALGVGAVPDIVAARASGSIQTAEIAALAPIVFELHAEEPARAILKEAASRLRRLVLEAAGKLGVENPRISRTGGIAGHPLMVELLALPLEPPEAPPEWGAIRWARQRLTHTGGNG